MANTGLHWLESWTLPLAFGAHGILGEDFYMECARRQKVGWFLPSPSARASQRWRVQAWEQRPGAEIRKIPGARQHPETSGATYVPDILGWEKRLLV